MKKNILTTLAVAVLCLGANAQIGGGILNKAKNKANNAIDKTTEPKSNGSTSSPSSTKPASSSSGGNTTGETPAKAEAAPAKPKAECIPFYKEGDTKYVKDDGFTSEAHKKYAGKIVFSKSKITKDAQNEATFTNTFGMNDLIYGRIYLPASLRNIPLYFDNNYDSPNTNYNGHFKITISVNGKELKQYLENSSHDGSMSTWTTWQCFVKASDPDDGVNEAFIDYMNTAPAGSYNVKVVVVAGTGGNGNPCKPVAEGEFTFIKKEGETIKLGVNFASKKAGMVNTSLEAAAMKCINDYAKSQGWKETFVKCKILSKDWYIVRNKYTSIIEGRTLSVYLLGRWPDGHCTGVDFSVYQQYDGSKYSSVFKYNGIGNTDKIDCE